MAAVDVVHLNPQDNICIAARNLDAGETLRVDGHSLKLSRAVKLGHKIALEPVAPGGSVRKYGQIIGLATSPIEPGDWVHSHNLVTGEFVRDPASATEIPPPPTPITDRTFQGYRRSSGRAGTRNYLAVISTVNCSAAVCKAVAQRFNREGLRDFPNIDGVVAFTHGAGCGMQFGGITHKTLNRVMGGIARHPNIGGFLVIGLGCEQGSIGYFLQDQHLVQLGTGPQAKPQSPPVFSMQDVGGTAKTIEAACRQVAAMLPQVNDVRRETIPASELVLGTNCGGSDGNSGVTCNPALGVASDLLVACGGTTVLAETTEIYGAEHLLTRRARSVEVADKLLKRIEWWHWYTKMWGCDMDNNPSVGNKEGGLTTIAEKSLGAVAKAGSTALVDVVEYAEQVNARGFVVMDTPGFDPVSVTGLVAGGANLIVFTTGRGSCFGCKPSPTIKVASNTPMYERMIDDMDINAGEILAGRPVADVGREIFDEMLAVASGKKTKSEAQGLGDEEFVPWHLGPVL